MNIENRVKRIEEGMADFETRILWCENMLTPSYISLSNPKTTEEPKVMLPKEHRLYNELQQLKARFIYLEGKIHSYTDKKTKKDTYTIKE